MKRKLTVLVVFLLMLCTMTACQPEKETPDPKDTETTQDTNISTNEFSNDNEVYYMESWKNS